MCLEDDSGLTRLYDYRLIRLGHGTCHAECREASGVFQVLLCVLGCALRSVLFLSVETARIQAAPRRRILFGFTSARPAMNYPKFLSKKSGCLVFQRKKRSGYHPSNKASIVKEF
jgi:hypothetical protein